MKLLTRKYDNNSRIDDEFCKQGVICQRFEDLLVKYKMNCIKTSDFEKIPSRQIVIS